MQYSENFICKRQFMRLCLAYQLELGPSQTYPKRIQLDEPFEHDMGGATRRHRIFARCTGRKGESLIAQILSSELH